MPTYDYFCRKCGYEEAVLIRNSETKVNCPDCGIPLEMRLSAPNIHTSSKTAPETRIIIQDLPSGFRGIDYESPFILGSGIANHLGEFIIDIYTQESEREIDRVFEEIVNALD